MVTLDLTISNTVPLPFSSDTIIACGVDSVELSADYTYDSLRWYSNVGQINSNYNLDVNVSNFQAFTTSIKVGRNSFYYLEAFNQNCSVTDSVYVHFLRPDLNKNTTCYNQGDSVNLVTRYTPYNSSNVSDRSGNIYNTVNIGTQNWMSENLTTSLYNNGDSMQVSTTVPHLGYNYYNNDTSYENTVHKKLYGWRTVIDNREVCPPGWLIPTKEDSKQLSNFLGGDSVSGYNLKSTTGWNNNGNGSNSSGFNAYPGGFFAEFKF